MMQPILDYRADAALTTLLEALGEQDTEDVFAVAEDIFGIDCEGAFEDAHGEPVEFDRENAMDMIEGRMLDAFARVGLAKFNYVDYTWAKAEGIVP